MESLQRWAQPWWVNLLIFIPVLAFWRFRRKPIELSGGRLSTLAAFALAFGFVEAAVVVYLRAAAGLLPGYYGTLAEVQRARLGYTQADTVTKFPQSLLSIEMFREAATMVMLATVACLSASRARNRWAAFLWTFAVWDIAYYAGLWATLRWPASLGDADVLFLIPTPWFAPVWFPLLVSTLTAAVILASRNSVTPARP
jgi:hypothetical protein